MANEPIRHFDDLGASRSIRGTRHFGIQLSQMELSNVIQVSLLGLTLADIPAKDY